MDTTGFDSDEVKARFIRKASLKKKAGDGEPEFISHMDKVRADEEATFLEQENAAGLNDDRMDEGPEEDEGRFYPVSDDDEDWDNPSVDTMEHRELLDRFAPGNKFLSVDTSHDADDFLDPWGEGTWTVGGSERQGLWMVNEKGDKKRNIYVPGRGWVANYDGGMYAKDSFISLEGAERMRARDQQEQEQAQERARSRPKTKDRNTDKNRMSTPGPRWLPGPSRKKKEEIKRSHPPGQFRKEKGNFDLKLSQSEYDRLKAIDKKLSKKASLGEESIAVELEGPDGKQYKADVWLQVHDDERGGWDIEAGINKIEDEAGNSYDASGINREAEEKRQRWWKVKGDEKAMAEMEQSDPFYVMWQVAEDFEESWEGDNNAYKDYEKLPLEVQVAIDGLLDPNPAFDKKLGCKVRRPAR